MKAPQPRPPYGRRPAGATARRPALFIDKDGTLVENRPYNVDPSRQHFMPGAGTALARLAAAGFALVVVSNQSGIARGLFTRADFARLERVLRRHLLEYCGVRLDGVLLCPHLPDAQGRPACRCRKPAPGMLLRAAWQLRLDLTRSWMVGDTLDDVEAGHRAGCRSLLFDSGGETLWLTGPLRDPEHRVRHWDEVARLILPGAGAEPASPAGGIPCG